MKLSSNSILFICFGIFYLFNPSKGFAQGFQLGVSAGPASLYVDENSSTTTNYRDGIVFQTDFIFLDSNQLPKYGYSLYSYGANSYFEANGKEFENGLITNTGANVSRYFSSQFTNRISGNLQIGAGLNLETMYTGITKLMLNINAGAELRFQLSDNWFLQAKGIAVAQDLPNIIRFYAFDEYQEAGEDLQLLLLFGVAVNIGK